jgi:hypothetical protein
MPSPLAGEGIGNGNQPEVVRLAAHPSLGIEAVVALGVVLLLAGVGLGLARWRSRRSGDQPIPRLVRILAAATGFAGAITTMLMLELFSDPAPVQLVVIRTVIAFAAFLLIGLILSAIADFLLGFLRPRRTLPWLAIALGAFFLCVATYFSLVAWADRVPIDVTARQILEVGIVASFMSFAWWACLAPRRKDVSRVFD